MDVVKGWLARRLDICSSHRIGLFLPITPEGIDTASAIWGANQLFALLQREADTESKLAARYSDSP